MENLTQKIINDLINENEKHFLKQKNIKSIFLDDVILTQETFRKKKALLFDGVNISFQHIFFHDCSLNYSVLRKKSSFINCTFINCNLSNIFFEGNILNCNFINCNFFETEFVGINIDNSLFIDSDFSSFFLANCQIKKSKFLLNRNVNEDCISNNVENSVIWINTSMPDTSMV